ncbi:MAG: hypothetical protein V7K25_11265 [Nostoc sp.]
MPQTSDAVDAFVIVATETSHPDSGSLAMVGPALFPASRICDFPSTGI